MNKQKLITLFIIGLFLWAFIVYVEWFATASDIRAIGGAQIDKLAHAAGGVFLALAAEWKFRRLRLAPFLLSILAVTVAWELWEFLFDLWTRNFYALSPDLWLLDSAGDITAAFLGAYGYWVFFRSRS